jgi:hypothetical protein
LAQNPEGIEPVKRLLWALKRLSDDIPSKEMGMEPDKLLYEISRRRRFDNFAIEDGILP